MEFPHLVKMHRQYAKDGFVAMSVSLDDPKDDKVMGSVREFLREQKATFANFVLNEEQEVWQEKLGINSVPAIFVFGRDGKKVGNFVDYDEVEKRVPELLKKKE